MTSSSQKFFSIALGLITFLSLVIFLKFSQEVLAATWVIEADMYIASQIYELRQPALTGLMLFFTSLANTSTLIIAIGVATILFFTWHRKTFALLLLGSSFGSYIFVLLAKFISQRARPSTMHALITEHSFSFPSGHALIAIAFYGLLAYFFMLILKPVWARICVLLFSVSLILAIGFSRVYLGVHWPSDVIASYIIGIGWLSFLILCLQYKEEIKTFLQKQLKRVRPQS